MSKSSQLVHSVTKSPFLWGVLGSVGFYGLIHAIPPKAPGMEFVLRYFTHHPVEYMETVMFSIGLAALVVKVFDIAAQRSGLKSSRSGGRQRRNRAMSVNRCLTGWMIFRAAVRASTTLPGCVRHCSMFADMARPTRSTTN